MNDQDILLNYLTNACDKIGKLLKYNFDKTIFESDSTNISGDNVKKIDIMAHNIFEEEFKDCKLIGGIASEELEEPIIFDENKPYVLIIDPLDGSSNIDVNITTGSIFSIYKVNDKITNDSFLQDSSKIIMAGFSLYGPSTALVVADNNGVKQYQILNGVLKEYHESIQCPEFGGIFSMNPSNYFKWDPFDRELYSELITFYNQFRYVGSLVAEIHRLLHKGGLFAYPKDNKNADGKLRLIYECIPMAYIISKAGGYGSNGKKNLLKIKPKHLHQKSPLYVGSSAVMKKYIAL